MPSGYPRFLYPLVKCCLGAAKHPAYLHHREGELPSGAFFRERLDVGVEPCRDCFHAHKLLSHCINLVIQQAVLHLAQLQFAVSLDCWHVRYKPKLFSTVLLHLSSPPLAGYTEAVLLSLPLPALLLVW